MKKLFYIFSLVAAAALTLVSCVQEQYPEREESPAELATCYGVFFPPQDASGSHILSPVEDTKLTITVGRNNTEGAITVPVKTYFSEDGIFTLGDITFADGQAETTVDVRFDSAVEGTVYTASIVIEDNNYASLYNKQAISIDFDVMRVEVLEFKNPKTGATAEFTLNEGWWGEVHMAKMQYYEVNGIRTCTFISTEEGNGIWGDAVDATLKFTWYTQDNNNEGNNFLEVPKQYFGFDYDGWASVPEGDATYPIYVYDYPWYWVERGYAFGSDGMGANWLEEAKATGQVDGKYPVGYYDGNGGFYFNLRYYIPGLGGFSPDPYEFVAICDGFVRVDYSLDLDTDFTTDGVTPVFVEVGRDVKCIKYAVYEGELTPTQVNNKVNAIVDGTDASTAFEAFEVDEETGLGYATLAISPETTGKYTVVVVAYDAEASNAKAVAQNSGSVVINHIAAADAAEYAVELTLGAEEVPARYGEYDATSSFAFYIMGKDIVDAHFALLKTASYEAAKDTYDAAIKAAEKGVSVVTEAQLADINKVGGLYLVKDGLTALTSYTVVVWATNGDAEVIKTVEWTTEGLPNELICTGTYAYSQFFNGNDPEQKLYLNPNFANTYVLTNWGNGVDFTFTVDPETGIIDFDAQWIGYTHSTYGDVYIFNSKDYFSEDSIATTPALGEDSYLDKETGIYYFNTVYAVSAGYFGCGFETFTPASEDPAPTVASIRVATDNLVGLHSFDFSPKFKTFERELKPAQVIVNAIPGGRKDKAEKSALKLAKQPLK